jgi:hypothetical protein
LQQSERDGLDDLLARLDERRIGQAERRAEDLERGIRPVALVFHFKDIAGEPDVGPESRIHLMRQAVHVTERYDGLIGRDRLRQSGFGRAAECVTRGTGKFRWVENAEPDAVLHEVGVSQAVYYGLNDTVRAPRETAAPREIDLPLAVRHIESDPEGVVSNLGREVGDHVGNGAPVPIPDGHIDAPDDLALTESDVAQVAVFKQEAQRTGSQRCWLRQGPVVAIVEHALWQHCECPSLGIRLLGYAYTPYSRSVSHMAHRFSVGASACML